MGYRGTKRDQQESVHTCIFTRKYGSSSSSSAHSFEGNSQLLSNIPGFLAFINIPGFIMVIQKQETKEQAHQQVNGNPTRWPQCQPYPPMLKPIEVPSQATTSFGKCPTKKRCHTIDKSNKLINIAQSVLCLTPANTWMQSNTP